MFLMYCIYASVLQIVELWKILVMICNLNEEMVLNNTGIPHTAYDSTMAHKSFSPVMSIMGLIRGTKERRLSV